MISLTRDGDTFFLTSDDANGENDAMGSAISQGAPHLLKLYEDTPLDDDGILRVPFGKDDWGGLIEVCESLAVESGVDPDEAEACGEQVEQALNA